MEIRARYKAGALHPTNPSLLRDWLEQGEAVTLEVERDRSIRSHNHQFAFVAEAWRNLPEHLEQKPYAKNPDTLRKHALIACGFCDVHTVAAGDPEALASLLRREGQKAHGYCLTNTQGSVVVHYTPHSQTVNAMGGPEFQRSKEAILNWLATLLGVEPTDLKRAA